MTINDIDNRRVRTKRSSDYPVSLRPGVDFRDSAADEPVPQPTGLAVWVFSAVTAISIIMLGWMVLTWL